MAAKIPDEHSHVDALPPKPAVERLSAHLVPGRGAQTQAQSRLLEVLEALAGWSSWRQRRSAFDAASCNIVATFGRLSAVTVSAQNVPSHSPWIIPQRSSRPNSTSRMTPVLSTLRRISATAMRLPHCWDIPVSVPISHVLLRRPKQGVAALRLRRRWLLRKRASDRDAVGKTPWHHSFWRLQLCPRRALRARQLEQGKRRVRDSHGLAGFWAADPLARKRRSTFLSCYWVMPLGPFGDPGSGVFKYGNVSKYVSSGLIAPPTVK